MKTRVKANSIEAFQVLDLGRRQREVFDTISETGSITAKGIAYSLKIEINKVTGRINELMHKQIIKIDKIGKDKAGAKSMVNYYSVREESDPLNIFEKSWEEKHAQLYNWLEYNYPAALYQFNAIENHEL